jgi:hypothetical protein
VERRELFRSHLDRMHDANAVGFSERESR